MGTKAAEYVSRTSIGAYFHSARESRKLVLVIVAIAAGHVAAAGWDQFVTNVLLYEGFLHQILRDVGFMVPDLLNIYLPIQELKVHAKRRRVPASYLVTNNMALATLATAFSIWFISAIVL